MKMRIFSVLITIMLVLPILSVSVAAAGTVSTWSGDVASGFGGGTGTSSSPYLIQSAEQLAFLAKSCQDGTTYREKYVSLLVDVDLANKPWTPIGTDLSHCFRGIFLGNKHVISNLYVNNSSVDNQGLFGYVYGVTISDLTVQNAFVNGKSKVGGLVGSLNGTVSHCDVSGEIHGTEMTGGVVGYLSSGTISDSSNHASVSATNNYVGGILGYTVLSSCTITRCTNYSSVHGELYVGGISGMEGTISDCFNAGAVSGKSVGGIVGKAKTVINCGNVGTIRGTSETGGIVCEIVRGTIDNCWNGGALTGNNAGHIAYHAQSSDITNCYWPSGGTGIYNSPTSTYANTTSNLIQVSSETMRSVAFAEMLNKNLDARLNKTWSQSADLYDGYPYLEFREINGIVIAKQTENIICYEKMKFTGSGMIVNALFDDGSTSPISNYSISPSRALMTTDKYVTVSYGNYSVNLPITVIPLTILGSGTAASPYIIDSEEDLIEVAQLCCYADAPQEYLSAYYLQVSDVVFTTSLALPIGCKTGTPFLGDYNGNGHSITNVQISLNGDDPCGLFGVVSGSVHDLTLIGSSFEGTSAVGSFAGLLDGGSITHCEAESVLVTGSASSGFAGGIVGIVHNSSTISNCLSSGTISGRYCGGIVGAIDNQSSALQCRSKSTVTGLGPYSGGIAGILSKGSSISECINWGSVSTPISTENAMAGGIVACLVGNSIVRSSSNYGVIRASGDNQCTGGIAATIIEAGSINQCANYETVQGNLYTGGICAYAGANSTNAGDVLIDTCGNYGSVFSESPHLDAYSGGICGNQYTAIVRNCFNKGTVTATAGSGGGITGFCFEGSIINNCANIGSVNCYYASTSVGGIAGASGNSSISCCYNAGEIATSSFSNEIVGQTSNTTIAFCYSKPTYTQSSMQSDSFCLTLNGVRTAATSNEWVRSENACDGYVVPGIWHLENHDGIILVIDKVEGSNSLSLDLYSMQTIARAKVICAIYWQGKMIDVAVENLPQKAGSIRVKFHNSSYDQIKVFTLSDDYSTLGPALEV